MDTTDNPKSQQVGVILLRLAIGWHFLYEGFIKWYNPEWTAKGYLVSSQSFMKDFFIWLASDSMLAITNAMNTVGLLVVGVALVLGLFERIGAIVGMIMLLFFYLAHPPFPWLEPGVVEGNYWFVNKNLVEMFALYVVYLIPTGHLFGLDRVLYSRSKNIQKVSS